MKTVRYDDIRQSLKIGDIVLFQGKTSYSKLIKFLTRSKHSHIGMVWRSDDWDLNMLWESTASGKIPDFYDGILKHGVQTVALSRKIAHYDGVVSLRQLNKPLTNEMIEQLVGLRALFKNRRYEKNVWDLARAAIDLFDANEECLAELFCSELVAEALQTIGLIDQSLSASEFVPKDFDVEHLTQMYEGYAYGEEKIIKY